MATRMANSYDRDRILSAFKDAQDFQKRDIFPQCNPPVLRNQTIAALAQLPYARRVLDVGCGEGKLVAEMAKYTPGTVYGIDPSHGMIKESEKNTQGMKNVLLMQGDGNTLPFPDNSLSVVTWNMVGYYLNLSKNEHGKPHALAEVYRALEPGGRFVSFTIWPEYTIGYDNFRTAFTNAFGLTPSSDVKKYSTETAYTQIAEVFPQVEHSTTDRSLTYIDPEAFADLCVSCIGLYKNKDGSALTEEQLKFLRPEAKMMAEELIDVFVPVVNDAHVDKIKVGFDVAIKPRT